MIEHLDIVNLSEIELFYGNNRPIICTKTNYLKTCNSLIKTINGGEFDKVILSRVKDTKLKHNPISIFERLNDKYKNTFNYIISIENVGCWIGTTPEILVSINDKSIKTVSLAGTKNADNEKWGSKEIEEQHLVTNYIKSILEKKLTDVKVSLPQTINAGAVQHLKTEFDGELANTNDWIKLISELHPTPATCGIPKLLALKHIECIESHKRNFYTGFLGPISSTKKDFFVNLRCMEIIDDMGFLYLGGGITAKSNSLDEWNETERKSETLLSILNSK